MALTVACPWSSAEKRRPAQRSKSNASSLPSWCYSDGKVLRREICCRAELNATDSTAAIAASLRIGIDVAMRKTVSLPPSPNFREHRKPVDWILASDGAPNVPRFLSDVVAPADSSSVEIDKKQRFKSAQSLSSEEDFSSGYGSCDSSLGTASIASDDVVFISASSNPGQVAAPPGSTFHSKVSVMTPKPRLASSDLCLSKSPEPIPERHRWKSSSSSSDSCSRKASSVMQPEEEATVFQVSVALLVSVVAIVWHKLAAAWNKRLGIINGVLRVLKFFQPTIMQRLSSGSNLSSIEEDLGFGLGDESTGEESDVEDFSGHSEDRLYHQRHQTQPNRSIRARRTRNMDAAEAFGRRVLAGATKYAETVDVSGWVTRARTFVAEHPFVTAGAGAAACTIAVPAVVAVTVVAAFLGVFFLGFIFVEGTLLTIGAIFVGSILLGLGFVLLTVAVGLLLVYVGAANAASIASSAVALLRSRLLDSEPIDESSLPLPPAAVADDVGGRPHSGGRRGWGHHHHVRHHHAPGPAGRGHGLGTGFRHINGFSPNQLPKTVDEICAEETLHGPPQEPADDAPISHAEVDP